MRSGQGFGDMARILLPAVLRLSLCSGAFLMNSCLSPQTIDPTPVAARQPPVFQWPSLAPKSAYTCISDTTTEMAPVTFSMTFESVDGGPLSYRWFIDYDYDPQATLTHGIFEPGTFTPVPGNPFGSVTFAQASLGLTAASTGIHTLELVVATEFADDTPDQEPGRAVAADQSEISFKWVINYVGSGQCPTSS